MLRNDPRQKILAATAILACTLAIVSCSRVGAEVSRENLEITGAVALPEKDSFDNEIGTISTIVLVPPCVSCQVSEEEWEALFREVSVDLIVVPQSYLPESYRFFTSHSPRLLLDPANSALPLVAYTYSPVVLNISSEGNVVDSSLIQIQRPPTTYREAM